MDNYPDYTWGGDPRAPWNKDVPECPNPKCREELDPSWSYCPWCGTKAHGEESKCS